MIKLKELREAKGYTQEEIAEKIGVARTTYIRYEQGVRECSYETLIKLSYIFNVSIDYLLGKKYSGIISKEEVSHNPELLKLMTEKNIKRLKLIDGYEISDEELKRSIEFVSGIKKGKTGD